jgi:hypothetical protein
MGNAVNVQVCDATKMSRVHVPVTTTKKNVLKAQ